MPTNLREFLMATGNGNTAYALDSDDPDSQAKLNQLTELALRAERQGLTVGTIVTSSKGRDTRGLPFAVKAGRITQTGVDWLNADENR